jgi:multimeric flavodoxin WrbA
LTILGFSSSATLGGNVDRMVKYVLNNSGRPSEFINLTELSYSPCRACVELCAKDNVCKLDDGLKPYYPKLIEAEAVVLGTPSYFDNLNGFMAVFLERLWSFRHQRFPLEGKPFVVVASGGVTYPDQAIDAVKRRMTAYRAVFLGGVAYCSTIIPCFKCGYGTVCEVGASQDIYGTQGRRNLKITKDLFKSWEDNPEVVQQFDNVCQKLMMALTSQKKKGV